MTGNQSSVSFRALLNGEISYTRGLLIGWLLWRAASVDALLVRDSRYAAEAWLRANVTRHAWVVTVDEFGYLPRLDRFRHKQIQATIEDTLSNNPEFIVVNTEFLARSPAGSPERQWLDWLQGGAGPYAVASRHKSPLGWSAFAWQSRFTDRREDDFTNIDKANPEILIFRRRPEKAGRSRARRRRVPPWSKLPGRRLAPNGPPTDYRRPTLKITTGVRLVTTSACLGWPDGSARPAARKIPAQPTTPPPAGFGPPEISCPSNISLAVTGSVKPVPYPTPALNGGMPPVLVSCSPQSGGSFPLGNTTVNCTATDAARQQATCSFQVTLRSILSRASTFVAFGDSVTEGENGLAGPGFHVQYLDLDARVPDDPAVAPARRLSDPEHPRDQRGPGRRARR